MVVMKKLGVSWGGSATSQQVLKMKIDGLPRKREATLESAVWQATSRKAREVAHPQFVLCNVLQNPNYTFRVNRAHPPFE
jgi:hypothetical protein